MMCLSIHRLAFSLPILLFAIAESAYCQIDVRDISNVDCSAATDSSAAFAALFIPQKEFVFHAGCNLKLTSIIQPNSGGAWSTHGSSGSGGYGAGTTINCSMSGGPCLWFDRQRDSNFGQFNINAGSASAGIQISQLASTTGQISTNSHWHDLFITSGGGSGILLAPPGDSGSNNELQNFSNVGLVGNGTGTGLNVANPLPNCRSLGLTDVSTNSFGVGYALGCASMHMIGGLQESNVVDFTGNSSIHTLGGGFIAGTHSESSKQWISNFGAGSFGFLFNRNEMDTPDLTKYQWDLSLSGDFISIGNHWGPNANVTKMVALSGQGGNWISIGDNLPNTTKTSLPDLSHTDGMAINIGTVNRFNSAIAISDGANWDFGDDRGATALYLSPNDTSDGGANQAFYASPGLDIAAMFINTSGARVYIPWRFVVTGGPYPSGNNPPATLSLSVDKDPITGTAPLTGGPLSMDFTGGVANGGTFKVPGGSANKAVCWKGDGKSLGFCSSQPDPTGSCTCN